MKFRPVDPEAAPLKDIVYGDEQTLDRVKDVLRKEFALQTLEGNTLREIVDAIKKRTPAVDPIAPRNGGYISGFASPACSPASLLDAIAPADLAAPAAFDILKVCLALAAFLMQKNRAYGNSALEPVRAMSKADPAEQIRVRMDDKLSRMIRGTNAGEDPVKDFVGYWVLLQILEGRSAARQTGD